MQKKILIFCKFNDDIALIMQKVKDEIDIASFNGFELAK